MEFWMPFSDMEKIAQSSANIKQFTGHFLILEGVTKKCIFRAIQVNGWKFIDEQIKTQGRKYTTLFYTYPCSYWLG